MLWGVGVRSRVGAERKVTRIDQEVDNGGGQVSWLVICVFGEVLSCFMNLRFVYGAEVVQSQGSRGQRDKAPNVLWWIIVSSGL
jgi:hypothetical protein